MKHLSVRFKIVLVGLVVFIGLFIITTQATQDLKKLNESYSAAMQELDGGGAGLADEISTSVAKQQAYFDKMYGTMYVVNTVAMFGVLLLFIYLAVTLTKGLRVTLDYIKLISNGDFTNRPPEAYLNRRDDFGKLANSLEEMRQHITKLVKNVKVESENINGVVDMVALYVTANAGHTTDNTISVMANFLGNM